MQDSLSTTRALRPSAMTNEDQVLMQDMHATILMKCGRLLL